MIGFIVKWVGKKERKQPWWVNNTFHSFRLQMVLLSISNTLPADLQFGPFNRTIFESLANEPKGINLASFLTLKPLFLCFGNALNKLELTRRLIYQIFITL